MKLKGETLKEYYTDARGRAQWTLEGSYNDTEEGNTGGNETFTLKGVTLEGMVQ